MDVLSVVGLIISGAAAVISVMAWQAAQRNARAAERQANAAERQANEAFRTVQDSKAVALYQAQVTARDAVPKVTFKPEDSYGNPCVLTSSYGSGGETASRPAPEKLDPIKIHRLNFLGKRFRGIVVNDDVHPVTLKADRGVFVEGVTPLWPEPLSLPQTQSGNWRLGPGQAALLEWFGACTVIDWYELARMHAKAPGTRGGLHVPHTVIEANRSGDDRWVPPAWRVVLEFERLPVYLPEPDTGHDSAANPELLLLGGDGRGVGCDVRYQYPRVPQAFRDLSPPDS